jgi:peptidoglycan/xylan/chitin deacetylase (PgdA/CDA1 family)
VLERSGAGALTRAVRRGGPVVLCYHRVGDPTGSPYDRAAWDATPEEFDEQLAFLAENFEVVGPDAELRRGRVLITFDDGYRDNHDVAWPLLRRHGLTATFFVTTGFIDDGRPAWWDQIAWSVRSRGGTDEEIRAQLERYKQLPGDETAAFLAELATAPMPQDVWMTWDHVRALRDGGMTIGGHSVTHPVLSRLTPREQQAEIEHCGERLRQELGQPMRWFSYPVGLRDAFDEHTRAALRAAGVERAFSLYGAGRGDDYDVHRCSVARVGRERFRAMTTLPAIFGRD